MDFETFPTLIRVLQGQVKDLEEKIERLLDHVGLKAPDADDPDPKAAASDAQAPVFVRAAVDAPAPAASDAPAPAASDAPAPAASDAPAPAASDAPAPAASDAPAPEATI